MPEPEGTTGYYRGKEALLSRIFGVKTSVVDRGVLVGDRVYPVVDDVIVVDSSGSEAELASDVQWTFGDQWARFHEVTDEHRAEFELYFDLIDLGRLNDAVVADLGCGSGRYAACLAPYAGSLVLVDFSHAIFVARRNLAHTNAVFVKADLLRLPFGKHAFDFAYSLGVLHHLPVDALNALRRLSPLSPWWLVYLYYALDNRPAHFRYLLRLADRARLAMARLRSHRLRHIAVWVVTLGVYWPLSRLGRVTRPLGLNRLVPLGEFYANKSLRRMRQDAHDRFLTPIEQRVTREQIVELEREGGAIKVSDELPYWHFTWHLNGMDAEP